MNLHYSNAKTKTAGSYFYVAADGFFNALSFNDRVRASANFAERIVQTQNHQQSLRKLSCMPKVARKVCGSLRANPKSPTKFAEAFVQAQSHQQSLRADLRNDRNLFEFDFSM